MFFLVIRDVAWKTDMIYSPIIAKLKDNFESLTVKDDKVEAKVPGGVASTDGRLMKGDQILAVNGQDIRNMSHEGAATVLKTTSGKICLRIGRFKASNSASASQ
nr:inaD-like protein [Halyomorpha halys]